MMPVYLSYPIKRTVILLIGRSLDYANKKHELKQLLLPYILVPAQTVNKELLSRGRFFSQMERDISATNVARMQVRP